MFPIIIKGNIKKINENWTKKSLHDGLLYCLNGGQEALEYKISILEHEISFQIMPPYIMITP